MKTYSVTLLEIGLLTGTRAIAAGGLALLFAKKLDDDRRQAVGWSLLGAGSVIYLTLIADLLLRNRRSG